MLKNHRRRFFYRVFFGKNIKKILFPTSISRPNGFFLERNKDLNFVPQKVSSIKYVRKIFRKTNISYPLIDIRACGYLGVRNVSFSEHFADVLNNDIVLLFTLEKRWVEVQILDKIRTDVKTKNLKAAVCRCSANLGILENFANFTGKHLCWSLFLINLQAWSPATLLKRDSSTNVIFLLNLQNF